MTAATRHGDLQHPDRTQPTAKSRIGLIVALSMAAGLIAAVLLVAMPFIPPRRTCSPVWCCWRMRWAGRCWPPLSTRFERPASTVGSCACPDPE